MPGNGGVRNEALESEVMASYGTQVQVWRVVSTTLPARAHFPTRRAEVATILTNDRIRAARIALAAEHRA